MKNASGLELGSSNNMFILTPSVPRMMGQQELSSLSQPTSTKSGAIDVGGGDLPSLEFTQVH